MRTGIVTRMTVPLLTTAALSGCALLGLGSGSGSESQLERGIAAVQAQDYATARSILEPLFRAHPDDDEGERALVLLTTLELDPRNPARRLYAASDYATSLLNLPELPVWQKPIAEALYLLSIELGGHEQELDRIEAAKDSAVHEAAAAKQRALPVSTRESWPARLRRVEAERDALDKKVESLQASLHAREKELADAKQELQRIKKTLKIK
jgi:hypothetical protein